MISRWSDEKRERKKLLAARLRNIADAFFVFSRTTAHFLLLFCQWHFLLCQAALSVCRCPCSLRLICRCWQASPDRSTDRGEHQHQLCATLSLKPFTTNLVSSPLPPLSPTTVYLHFLSILLYTLVSALYSCIPILSWHVFTHVPTSAMAAAGTHLLSLPLIGIRHFLSLAIWAFAIFFLLTFTSTIKSKSTFGSCNSISRSANLWNRSTTCYCPLLCRRCCSSCCQLTNEAARTERPETVTTGSSSFCVFASSRKSNLHVCFNVFTFQFFQPFFLHFLFCWKYSESSSLTEL